MAGYIALAVLTGCASNSKKEDGQALTVNLTAAEPNRIRFEGKGAGAGMMLMSAMGPMGIAIGVAIDEGIGKDIQKTASEGSVDPLHILKQSLEEAGASLRSPCTMDIYIERYGFKTQAGENDPVIPVWKIKTLNKETPLFFDYPSQFSEEYKIQTTPLDDIKTDSNKISVAFLESSKLISKKLIIELCVNN